MQKRLPLLAAIGPLLLQHRQGRGDDADAVQALQPVDSLLFGESDAEVEVLPQDAADDDFMGDCGLCDVVWPVPRGRGKSRDEQTRERVRLHGGGGARQTRQLKGPLSRQGARSDLDPLSESTGLVEGAMPRPGFLQPGGLALWRSRAGDAARGRTVPRASAWIGMD